MQIGRIWLDSQPRFTGHLTAMRLGRIAWNSAAATLPAFGLQMPDAHASSNSQSRAARDRPNPNTLHQSAPDLHLHRDQRELWRLRCGGIHLGLFFLPIDVDRTGADRPFPTLRSGKYKYGFHACGADPPHLRLRPVLMPPCWEILIAKRRD